jgi:hypothetical protein
MSRPDTEWGQRGAILFNRHELDAARAMFVIAAQGEQRARGACLLGLCEQQRGNRTAVESAFQTALSTPDAPENVRDTARRSLMWL